MCQSFLIAIFVHLLLLATAAAQVAVAVDSSVKYQTIEGWGHGSADLATGWGAVDSVDYQYIDFLVDDWGLTGTRITEVGPRIDGSGMDAGDCDSIDWTKFQPGITKYFTLMRYFKDHVVAEGFQPSFYSSTNYASLAASQKPWILNHPGERAQEIWANAVYWRDHYGIEMNYAVIMNEPSGSWTPQIIADDIKALGPRLVAHGLSTKAHFAECVAPQTDWTYITAVRGDTDMWPFVGRLSYHNYGTADPYRSYIRDFGDSMHIPTAQTEMDPDNIDNLFDDLILGGVSYWEVAFSNGNTVNPNPGYTSFTPTRYYYRIRQVTHYVRPGAVRIGTTTNDSSVRVLSFVKNEKFTTIVYNTGASPKTITVHGLPAGMYGLSQAAPAVIAFQELGVQTVSTDATATITIGSGVAATLYPYAEPNHAPTIMTWGSNPGVIHLPASSSTLSVTANDPERDSLTYKWSIVSQPGGGAASLATPASATTTVSGLTAAGTYVFNIDVHDRVNTTSRKVYLIVYETNQPPQFGFTGFRLSSPYGVILDFPNPNGSPLHTSVTLPTTTGILQANIGDLENDPLTGKWTIVRQPAGANAGLDSTISIYGSFRCHIINMSVPGDYVFQIAANDPTHAPITVQVVCTVLVQNTPPAIASILALPNSLTLPASMAQLSAVTMDAENDLLRHWWVVKSAPRGARPLFDHQGLAHCTVSNLLLPGTYTFTVRTFDDISMTTKDVTVIVSKSTGIGEFAHSLPSTISLGQNIPNPAVSSTTIPFTLAQPQFVTLKLFDWIGREIATLLNERRPAGAQQVEFQTNGLPSGLYLYRMSSGGEDAVHVMLLVR